jgi:hypothetical protein
MDKEYFTNLTNDLYRLTLFFPKKEPLRYKMRDFADNVLSGLTMILEGEDGKCIDILCDLKKNITPMDSFFEIVKKQNWVKEEDVVYIQERYKTIKEEIYRFEDGPAEEDKPKEVKIKTKSVFADFNNRQKKIVEILQEKDKVQVNELESSFPQITKRTIRRDFDFLVKKGFVKRIGKANMTFYRLADNEN